MKKAINEAANKVFIADRAGLISAGNKENVCERAEQGESHDVGEM